MWDPCRDFHPFHFRSGCVTAYYGPSRCKYLPVERSADQKASFHHLPNRDKSPEKGTENEQKNYQPSKQYSVIEAF